MGKRIPGNPPTAYAKTKQELFDMRLERDYRDNVIHDLMVGDPERGGKHFVVTLQAGEFGGDEHLAAHVFRPLGGMPLIVVVSGREHVNGPYPETWLARKDSTDSTWPLAWQVLRERVRVALRNAREGR